jgi:hypothetical protein
MTLAFPNPSRSFDEARNAVRFVGHDGMFEVWFLVETGALAKPDSSELSEADVLRAFDAARCAILDVARKAYARRRRRTSFVLTAADFR